MWKQNIDYYFDEFVNKIIKKEVRKHSTKCAGDNLDKTSEFIFDDNEEKIESKILRILK